MSDHEWVRDNLDAFVAGGLSADERARIEQHVAACAECSQALAQARMLETKMATLFADAHPDAKLEDRMIRGLRKAPTPFRVAPWMRFVAGAAAVVMLGTVGVVVQALAGSGAFGWGERDALDKLKSDYNAIKGGKVSASPDTIDAARAEAVTVFDGDIAFQNERIDEVSVPGLQTPPQGVPPGGMFSDGRTETPYGKLATSGETKYKEWRGEGFKDKAEKVEEMRRAPQGGDNLTVLGATAGESAPTSKKGFHSFGFSAGGAGNGVVVKAPPQKISFADGFYYGMTTDTTQSMKVTQPPAPSNLPPPKEGPPPPGADGDSPDGAGPPKGTNPSFNSPTLVQGPKGEPIDNSLKIIRTGEMEFEVDSFDNAVKSIMALLKPLQTKGAFKLKEDSNKQANGKTRGHVVVRMKPEHLDDFVLDLRRELGKVGDLKLQRIGSQDVTKVYFDTESELKAARAVEKRLLDIIENKKGEVKDFVAAEKELGVWRTKIEKLEGDLRFYSNQVALSTLTITLTEKEITAAAALVVSSTVKMRIEADNVSRARETAEKAVEDLKGRIVRSDEKQLPAGQVEAILHAEIPPANKDAFRRVLEKLGIVSAHEDAQTQATEGGSGPVLTPKRRVNDVLFQVTLNNIVNIKPKLAVKLDVVTPDVRGNFEKLKDEIIRVHKGQVREARLDENQDKQKAIAVIEFSVPIEKKSDMDKLIASFGPTLDRVNSQAAITEISTEQKFGYTLTLYSISNVEPREKVKLHVEVKSVKQRTDEIMDIVKAAKGQVNKPKSGLNKQGKTEALLVITAPLASSDALVTEIKEKGKVIDWAQAPNPTVPENELATAQIVVLLTGPDPIIPNDEGFGAYASHSLGLSFKVFATCVLFIFAGLSFLAPWLIVVVVVVWVYRRIWRKPTTVAVVAPEAPKAG